MKNLADTYQKLNDDQTLDLDTVLELIEKYPELSTQLLEAGDNADKQREAIKALYEAKKSELIQRYESKRIEQEETNAIEENTLASYENALAVIDLGSNSNYAQHRIAELKKKISELTSELHEGYSAAEKYKNIIDRLNKWNISDYTPSTSSDSNGGSSSSGGSEKTVYTTSGRGIEATGNTAADSRLKWLERAKNLYDLSLEEQIHYLNEILRNEVLTADEVYEVNYKLKQALDKQQEERTKKAEEEAKAREEAEKNTLWTTKGGGE